MCACSTARLAGRSHSQICMKWRNAFLAMTSCLQVGFKIGKLVVLSQMRWPTADNWAPWLATAQCQHAATHNCVLRLSAAKAFESGSRDTTVASGNISLKNTVLIPALAPAAGPARLHQRCKAHSAVTMANKQFLSTALHCGCLHVQPLVSGWRPLGPMPSCYQSNLHPECSVATTVCTAQTADAVTFCPGPAEQADRIGPHPLLFHSLAMDHQQAQASGG